MFLPLLGRAWPYVAIGLLSLSLYGALKYASYQSRLADAATEIANANAAIIDQERAEVKRINAILETHETQRIKRAGVFSQQRTAVATAKPSQDGPIAPVLRSVLDSLPERPTTSRAGEG